MNIFSRLKVCFTHGPELKTHLDQLRQDTLKAEFESRKHNLNLCYKHRQEQNFSHYSEKNCDYCKLLEKCYPESKEPCAYCEWVREGILSAITATTAVDN